MQFINLISGAQVRVGEGLRSHTHEVQTFDSFELLGRRVTLIDTPGFDDTTMTDTEVLRLIGMHLSNGYVVPRLDKSPLLTFMRSCREDGKLSGVVWMHRISDPKMGGISPRNFRLLRALFGEATLEKVVVVTNMWSQVNEQEGIIREHELATDDLLFKPALGKGAQMMRHNDTVDSARNIIQRLVEKPPQSLQIQTELLDDGKDLQQTCAGRQLETQEMGLSEAMTNMGRHYEETETIKANQIENSKANCRIC